MINISALKVVYSISEMTVTEPTLDYRPVAIITSQLLKSFFPFFRFIVFRVVISSASTFAGWVICILSDTNIWQLVHGRVYPVIDNISWNFQVYLRWSSAMECELARLGLVNFMYRVGHKSHSGLTFQCLSLNCVYYKVLIGKWKLRFLKYGEVYLSNDALLPPRKSFLFWVNFP